MLLFDIPSRVRVRIRAKRVRWLEGKTEQIVAENLTWEGTTTSKFYTAYGARRRLLVNHNIIGWKHIGIWSANVEAKIIREKKMDDREKDDEKETVEDASEPAPGTEPGSTEGPGK